jgi:hypothetical protein
MDEDNSNNEQHSKKTKIFHEPEIVDVDIDTTDKDKKDNSSICAICLESGNEENQLLSHQCSQCKKDAWKICDTCNQTRLSRLCPICNGDYAPLILHLVPGIIF